jgi:hypothetical protein
MPSVFTLEAPDLALLGAACPPCDAPGAGLCCGTRCAEGLCGDSGASLGGSLATLAIGAAAVLGAGLGLAIGLRSLGTPISGPELGGKRGKCPADVRQDLLRYQKVGRGLRRQYREQGHSFAPAYIPTRRFPLRDNEAIQRGQRLVAEADKAVRQGNCNVARVKLDKAAELLNWAAL